MSGFTPDRRVILLCMDGLDSELSKKLRLHMPHEATPTIEPEMCIQFGSMLIPHSMHVWPSMFAGRVVRHPYVDRERNVSPSRMRVRNILHSLGLKWKRRGTKIIPHGANPSERLKGVIYDHSVSPEDTVFKDHRSFIYRVPGLVDNLLLGGPEEWHHYEHQVWGVLAGMADRLPYDLVALYTRQPDHLGHMKHNPAWVYREGFTLAKRLEGDVMILSDHGCDPETGDHTMNGYIGATFPFKADSMLDVRKIIEGRM